MLRYLQGSLPCISQEITEGICCHQTAPENIRSCNPKREKRRKKKERERDHTTPLSVHCWFRKMFRKLRLHTGLAVLFHLDSLTQPHGCCLMVPSALLINSKAWIGNLGQCMWHWPSFTTTKRHFIKTLKSVPSHCSCKENYIVSKKTFN